MFFPTQEFSRLSLILGILLLCGSLQAQEELALKDWLVQKEQIISTAFEQSLLDGKFNPSWFEKLELRTETDEFSIPRQEYLIRVTPSTPAIRSAQKRLIQLNQADANLYQQELQEEIAKLVLDDLIEIQQLKQKTALQAELKLILEDQQTLARRLLQDPDYNPRKLMDIEEDLFKLKLQMFEDDKNLERMGKGLSFPQLKELINIEEIAKSVALLIDQKSSYLEDEQSRLDQEILEAEIRLEKAEKNRIIDFLQVRYQGPREDLLQERLSVSLGIEIPSSGSRKTKIRELNIEKWKSEQESQSKRQLLLMEIEKMAAELLEKVSTWEFSNQLLQENLANFQKLEANSPQAEWKNPELLLFRKAQLVDRRLDMLELEEGIYESYVDLLQKIGLTRSGTYRDYLIN